MSTSVTEPMVEIFTIHLTDAMKLKYHFQPLPHLFSLSRQPLRSLPSTQQHLLKFLHQRQSLRNHLIPKNVKISTLIDTVIAFRQHSSGARVRDPTSLMWKCFIYCSLPFFRLSSIWHWKKNYSQLKFNSLAFQAQKVGKSFHRSSELKL